MLSGPSTKEERSLSTLQESNKAVIRRFNKDFVETGDRAIYEEIVSPEFTNHSVHGDEPTDREASFFFFTAIFRAAFPDVKVAIHDQFADGDTVVTRKSYQGTHTGPFMEIPGTGKQVEIAVIEIIRLRDGKYVDHWATADMLGLLQQLKA
jgi:predicted ester cyclase